MYQQFGVGGIQRLTTTGAVLASGVPIRLFSMHWYASTTAAIGVYNGTSTGGTLILTAASLAGDTASKNFEGGIPFTSGCYVSMPISVTAATLVYVKEL